MVAFTIFGYSIHWYGIIIATGMLLGILLAMYHTKREGYNPDNILDMALIIVPLAVIFARIYYVVFQWNTVYSAGPFWKVFAIWEGGMAIYGGVIGGFIGVLIYWALVNKKQIKLFTLLDLVAPSLILGQAIGRWGNFVNQEAYGAIIDNPAWQWFPAAVYIQADGQYHMATFFYESMWNFLVFAFLFFYFKNSKTRKPGNVFWFYLLLYGVGRVVIEGLRTDSLYLGESDVRVSQWLSGILVVASAIALLAPVVKKYLEKRRQEELSTPLDDSLKLITHEDNLSAEAGSQGAEEAAPENAEPAETGEPVIETETIENDLDHTPQEEDEQKEG